MVTPAKASAASALLAALLCCCFTPRALAQAVCYPGVAPTADKPHIAHPKDFPYLTYRSWGVGAYWYCKDPATGKWGAWYAIGVYADLVAVLSQGETIDAVLRAIKDQFDAAKTPSEKRAVVDAAIARFRAPWQSCKNALDNNIQPQAGYCADIRDTACGRDTLPGERCRAMPPDDPAPTPPAPGTWVVAPTTICAAADKDASGKCVRRQAFAWDGKARGALTQDRATIGAPCVTTIGQEPYFGYDAARPDRVVACIRR